MKVQTVKGKIDSNTFVVETDDNVFVIDAGAPATKLGEIKPTAIFLTHEHYDHIFYIADYVEKFDCPVYCHPVLIEEFKEKNFGLILEEVKIPDLKNFVPITSTKKILGVKPIFAPGHSFCSILFQIEDNLFTGDVLFEQGIGRTDFIKPLGEILMRKTLQELLDIKFKIAHHGHGESSSYEKQIENIKLHITS